MRGRLDSLLEQFFTASEEYWFGPKSCAALDRFRRFLAVTLLIFFARSYPLLAEGLTEKGIHLPAAQAIFHRSLGLPLLPASIFPIYYSALLLSFAGLFVFPRRREPALLGAVLLYYLFDTDFISTYTTHILFLVSLLVLGLAPYSKNRDTMPAWPIRIIQLTLFSIYLGNGLGKLFFGGWLYDVRHLKSIAEGLFLSSRTIFLSRYLPDEFWVSAQHLSLLIELFLPWGLIYPATRTLAMAAGITLHLGIAIFLAGLWPFSMTMICLYAAFLPDRKLNEQERDAPLAGNVTRPLQDSPPAHK